MPGGARLGDYCSGHGCYPSRPNISASEDCFINDRGAHRVGDIWDIHTCIDSHGGVTITGSPDVFVNDALLARVGDQVDCGSTILTGSDDSLANE